MVPNGKVVSLRPRGRSAAELALLRLVAEADDALAAVSDGDWDAVFTAHRAISRAIGIALDNRIATAAWPNCPTCGAEVSQGRCWGCGRPPGRAR